MKKIWKIIFLLFLISVLSVCNTNSIPKKITIGQANNYENHWRIIAKSSNIYCVNSSYLKNNIRNYRINKYSEISIPIIKILKGEMIKELILRMYMDKEKYDFINSLPNSSEVIIFLQKHYNPWGPEYGNEYNYYLVDDVMDTIVAADENVLNYIIKEINFQDQIINEQLYKNFTVDIDINNKIKTIINDITNRNLQRKSFNKLEDYGIIGIPYIILALDDFRELPIKSISLRNNYPGAFEGLRHYGPNFVVDSLAAILNQITGNSFGFIYNGDETTDEERKQCIRGWYIYLYYLKNT
jgi:hypothetical protein